jgi:hypothetical protein
VRCLQFCRQGSSSKLTITILCAEVISAIQDIRSFPSLSRPTGAPHDPNLHHSLDWDHQILDGAPSGTFFIGRNEEMRLLRRGLVGHDGGDGSHRVILSGLSGMGKSQLAREYATRFSDNYQLVFWFDCTTTDTFQQGIDHLIDAIGLRHYVEGQSPLTQLSHLKKAFRKTSAPWLCILDNCNNATADKAIGFIPPTGGDIIFTANDAFVSDRLQEAIGRHGMPHPLQLSLRDLQKEASAKLLLHGLSREEAAEQVTAVMQIVDRIRGLPSILRHLRMLSRDLQLSGSYQDVLYRMQRANGRLSALSESLGWYIGPEQIRNILDSLSPAARAVVKILSCFLGSPVPEFVLNLLPDNQEQQASRTSSDDPEEGEVIAAGKDSIKSGFRELADVATFDRSIREIQRRYLIARMTVRQRKCIALHPAVAQTTGSLELFRNSPIDGQRTLRIAVDLCNAALPQYDGFLKLDVSDWEDGEAMGPTAIALDNLSRELGEQKTIDGSLKLLYAIACRKLFWAGNKRGVLSIISAVLGDISQPMNERPDSEFVFAYLLARVMTNCCYYQAPANRRITEEWEVPFLFRVHEECKTRFGDDDSRSINLQASLSTSLYCNISGPDSTENRQHVVQLNEEVALISERVYGKSHSRVLNAYAKVANSKARFGIGGGGSEELDWLAAQVDENSLQSKKSSHTLFWNMAVAYGCQGNYEKMKEFARLNFTTRRGVECRKHRGQLWDFLLYMESLVKTGSWNELGQLVQSEPVLVDPSRPHFLKVSSNPQKYGQILSRIIDAGYEAEDFEDFVGTANLKILLLLPNINEYQEVTTSTPPRLYDTYDIADEVAVWLYSCQLSEAETLVKRAFKFRDFSGGGAVFLTRQLKQAIHGLFWAVILKAQGFSINDENLYRLFEKISRGNTRQPKPLERTSVDLWYRLWATITTNGADDHINLDTVSLPDPYFNIPNQYNAWIIRAAVLGHPEVLDLILERKPDIHVENHLGLTAFYYAAWLHHFDILRRLLDGTPPGERPKFYFGSKSLLHLLCVETCRAHEDAAAEQADLALELLRRGHRPDYRYGKHPSPLETARANGVGRVVRVLEEHRRKYGWR